MHLNTILMSSPSLAANSQVAVDSSGRHGVCLRCRSPRTFLVALTMTALIAHVLPENAPAQSPNPSWSADPEIVEKLSQQRPEFNYRESRVPAYQLPNPLLLSDTDSAKAVDSGEAWLRQRRPELMRLFREEVYGVRPTTEFTVDYEIIDTIESAFDGAAAGQQIRTTVSANGREHQFDFVFFRPHAPKNCPIVVHINNRYFIDLADAAEKHDPFWPVKTLIDRGYATASFHTKHVDPDRADGYSEGIRALLDTPESDPKTRWRSLSAWGWAASRVLDYTVRQPGIDSERTAVVGHSRGGKTALWAAAEDPRFTIAYSNDSGCGGAALSRRQFGETVARITKSFPHWFTDRFAQYGGREQDLPIDQHELIALIAPRNVYVASADADLWADPRGEYLSIVHAAPVFKLFDRSSIEQPEMPPLNQPRHVGATGYHIRSGNHNLTDQDWGYFLDFADGRFANP